MIASSKAMQIAAALVAVGTHAVLAVVVVGDGPTARSEGAAGPRAEVRLGNAFADMTPGTVRPEPARTSSPEATDPETARAVKPLATAEHARGDSVPHAAPGTDSPEARVSTLMTSEAFTRTAPQQPSPRWAIPVSPDAVAKTRNTGAATRQTPERPDTLKAERSPSSTRVAPDAPAARQAEPSQAERREQAEGLTATDPENPTITRSPRPRARSPEFVSTHDTAPVAPETRADTTSNSRRGATTGKESASAAPSGGGARQEAGNAAADNYPGVVRRKLSRATRPNVRARGAAVVAFRIAADGSLAGVSVAQSSGTAALDQAALRLVQAAAPFPPPPNGARRSFSIRIEGR